MKCTITEDSFLAEYSIITAAMGIYDPQTGENCSSSTEDKQCKRGIYYLQALILVYLALCYNVAIINNNAMIKVIGKLVKTFQDTYSDGPVMGL